jgi:hypothetical protein
MGFGYGWISLDLLLSHDASRNTKKSGSMNSKVSILLLCCLSAIVYLIFSKKQRIFALQPARNSRSTLLEHSSLKRHIHIQHIFLLSFLCRCVSTRIHIADKLYHSCNISLARWHSMCTSMSDDHPSTAINTSFGKSQ